MTIRTLRPSGTVIDNVGGYTPTGAPTLAAALSDDSDSSKCSGVNNGTLVMAFGTYAMTVNERCIAARSRYRANALGTASVFSTWGNFTDGYWHTETNHSVGAPIGVQSDPYFTSFNGGEITQAVLDKIQMKVHSPDAPSLALIEEYIDIDIRTQPTVAITDPTLNEVNPGSTHQPVLHWTTTAHDGDVQSKYRIKVFDRAVNPSAAWTDTAGLVWDSQAVASGAQSRTLGVKLANGSWRVLIQVAKDFNGTDWWSHSDATNFTISDTLGLPTNLGPIGTITSPHPTLQANIIQSTFGAPGLVKARWRISKDPAFASGVTTYESALFATQEATPRTVFHTVIEGEQTLSQGVWYLQAKTVDEYGDESGWAGPVSFTVSHPLGSLNLTPGAGEDVPIGTVHFAWDISSTYPDAVQTAYRVLVIKTSDSSTVFDTGKVASGNHFHDQAAVSFIGPVQWRLTLWDEDDIAGPDSPLIPVDLVDAAIVAFTAPANGGTITFAHPTVQWSYAAGGGGAQKTKRVQVFDSADVQVYDSGTITSAVHSQLLGGPDFFVQGGAYRLELTVSDNADVESRATANVTVAFPPPPAPSGFLASVLTIPNPAADAGPFRIDTIAYGHLVWSPSALGNDFAYYEVFRTVYNGDGDELYPRVSIAHITDEGSSYFNDFECSRTPDLSAFNAYSVAVTSKTLGPGFATSEHLIHVPALDECDVYLTSNYSPDLSVAYQDRGPYEFQVGENDLVKVHRIFGKRKPMMFRPFDAEGDEFSRTLLMGMAQNGVAAPMASETGRIVYAPLLARIRDVTSPYVVVTDGMGYRWFAGIKFGGGTYAKEVRQYVGKIDITEVDDPEPVVALVPWTDEGS